MHWRVLLALLSCLGFASFASAADVGNTYDQVDTFPSTEEATAQYRLTTE